MATKLKQNEASQRFKTPAILIGLGLTFGWAIIMAITNLQVVLTYAISDSLSTTICLVPIYIGSALTPLGIVFYEQWPLIGKALVVIVATPILGYASLYAFSYLDIVFHGIAPF